MKKNLAIFAILSLIVVGVITIHETAFAIESCDTAYNLCYGSCMGTDFYKAAPDYWCCLNPGYPCQDNWCVECIMEPR
jgi:hypothetical protein